MAGGVGNKKPTAVASRGFLSKSFLTSTSTDGVADYDDQNSQIYLSNISKHCERKIAARGARGQASTWEIWD
jgi:hypothetical protein